MTTTEQVVTAMREPAFYPHRPPRVDLVQTHSSYVFLAGDQVFKLKKPVRFAFLDFSTLAQRRRFCREEVRLNRRLAPDTYLGVLPVRSTAAGFELGTEYVESPEHDDGDEAAAPEDGAPDDGAIDYVVHMRRLPEDRMLARLLDSGRAEPGLIEQVVAVLIDFHRRAPADAEVARGGDPAVIRRLLEDDVREVTALEGRTISAADHAAIQRYCRDFLSRNDALLRRRQSEGRIRDGHGDLHAEHICFTDRGVAIFDCIEFNPEFRRRDVAAEIAFLAMDLEYHRRSDLSDLLVHRYAAAADDPDLPVLVPFYACQRAFIRGKVDSLKSLEPEVDAAEREKAAESARRHFDLALRYTWSGARILVVVAGLSGSGKSTLARELHERTGFAHVDSDSTRKRLAGVALTARPGKEIYTPEWSARTYAAILDAAAHELDAGRSVIVDATFQRRADRVAARAVAKRAGAPIVIVECVCGEDEVRRRLGERAQRGDDASDADWAIYQEQRRTNEPFAPDEASDHLRLDTTSSWPNALSTLEERLREVAAL